MYQIRCQSVQPFDSFSRLLNLWPPKPPKMPPRVSWGDLHLAYAHFQMNPQTWTKVVANRSSRLTASPDFWTFDLLKHPSTPLCLEWQFVWRMSIPRWIPQTWTKVGANRSSRLTASQDFWMFDPLKPHKCPHCRARNSWYFCSKCYHVFLICYRDSQVVANICYCHKFVVLLI